MDEMDRKGKINVLKVTGVLFLICRSCWFNRASCISKWTPVLRTSYWEINQVTIGVILHFMATCSEKYQLYFKIYILVLDPGGSCLV